MLIQEALYSTRGAIAERGVEVEVQSDLPTIFGDRTQLLQVVQNLVDNTVKFMGDRPAPRIEIGALQQGDEQVFFIADNGIGIDPSYHEKVFGLFERLNAEVDGTGIGLALVKRIVEVHGGRVWLESEVGKGSRACFTLPLKDAEAQGAGN